MPAPLRFVLLILRRHPLLVVAGAAVSVRIAVAVAVIMGADGVLFPDDETYRRLAEQMAMDETANWEDGTRALFDRSATLLVPVTAAYLVFGVGDWPGPLTVAALTSITPVLVTQLARRSLPDASAAGVGLALAFMPSQVLWSSLVLKDGFVWALLATIAATIAARTSKRWGMVGRVAGFTVLLLLMAHLRIHTLVIACWAAALVALLQTNRNVADRAAIIAVATLVPWFLGIGPGGITLATSTATALDQVRLANAYGATTALVPPSPKHTLRGELSRVADEHTALAEEVRTLRETVSKRAAEPTPLPDLDNLRARLRRRQQELDALRARMALLEREIVVADRAQSEDALKADLAHLPRGLSAMLLEPYPWQAMRNRRLLGPLAEHLIWYPMLVLAGLGSRRVWRERDWLAFPVLACAGSLVVYALAEGNFGTAYRHRGEFIWGTALLAGLGLRTIVRGQASD